MGSIIGANPVEWVKDQVNLRQQLLGLQNRTPEVLSWMNTKTAWIRAASPISISTEKSEELTLSNSYAGRKLAQEFVLFNGVSSLDITQPTEDTPLQVSPIQKSGISTSNSIINSNVYGFGGIGNTGIVPMPGIKKLSVNTLSRGSLRKAKLDIKAYNREQFAILDALYMRPGYTILLEWGHTSYFVGSPGVKDSDYLYTQAEFDTTPFSTLMTQTDLQDTPTYTQDNILSDIRSERRKSGGNYDGFYGKITNFNWKFNDDGTYDISVDAISVGDVIESLTINRTLPSANVVAQRATGKKVKKSAGDNNTAGSLIGQIASAMSGGNIDYGFFLSQEGLSEDGSGTINVTSPSPSVIKDPQQREFSTNVAQVYAYREFWECKGNKGYEGLQAKGQTTRTITGNVAAAILTGLASTGVISNWAALYAYIKKTGQFKNTLNKWTLKAPSDTLSEPTPIGPDTLLVQRDKSKLNKYLYDKYNTLKGRTPKKVKCTSSGRRTISVSYINPNDSTNKDELMIHTKTVVTITDGYTGEEAGTTTTASANAPFQYIKLKNILRYIQEYLLIYGKDGEPFINIDYVGPTYCYTFPEQFSSNPLICVIPFKTRSTDDPEKYSGVYWEEVLGTDFKVEGSNFVGNLLEIHVNLHYVAAILEATTKGNGTNFLQFLQQLMQGIQDALGSVNKFSVTYDHDSNTVYIQDDLPLDPAIVGTKVPEEKRTLLNAYGYKKNEQNGSFITNLGISATLSKEFATMIAIGAQARSTSDVSNATAFSKWNVGLQDVIFPSKLSAAVIEKDADNTKDPFELFKETIDSLEKRGNVIYEYYYLANQPSKEAIESTKSLNAELARYLGTYYNTDKNVPSLQGFIPFNMSMKMEGFSGFKIYEKFYITTEILPPSYPNNLSFIVKGLKHDISDNGWETTLESLSVQSVDGELPLSTPLNTIDNPK